MIRVELFLLVLLTGPLVSELGDLLTRLGYNMLDSDLSPSTVSLVVSLLILGLLLSFYCVCCLHPQIRRAVQPISYIEREFNLFRKKVKIKWPDDWTASNTKSVEFSMSNTNSQQDNVILKICHNSEELVTTRVWDEETGSVEVIFPARQAGEYRFLMTYSGNPVRGSPWERFVLPGPPDPAQSKIVNLKSQTSVLRSGGSLSVYIEPRDCFDNQVSATRSDCDQVTLDVDPDAFYEIFPGSLSPHNIEIRFTFTSQTFGAFPVIINYQKVEMGRIQLLVLSPPAMQTVTNYLAKMGYGFGVGSALSNAYFEAQLIKLSGSMQTKPRTVYVYLTDKQMIIREFYLKVIPHKIVSFRLCPQVKLNIGPDKVLSIHHHDNDESTTCLTGDNDTLLSLTATYYTILLRRSGGSESFGEKRIFFWTQLVKHHEELNHRHTRLPVTIDRFHIWESTYKASRHFLQSDWARLWEIFFEGEPGVDQGGLRREWFELITKFVFDPENEIFVPIEENSRSVGPNPYPPPHIRGKHYRLAGKLVGKALYESSHGDTYRLQMNARITHSLLAQMIGIGVHFTMLEVDAPELWRTKIKYILDHEVDFLDLTFTQEEVRPDTKQLVTVDLINNGSKMSVTEKNKKSYITSLSEYLLNTRVKWQVTAFLEGLHTLVPDHLLALWDEKELELLLCGVRDYSVTELKKYHTVVGVAMGRYGIVLDWFWQVLTHMGKEDLTRFVQFCTGSSLLPPGGWAALRPFLQISWGGAVRGSLPTSHTCFNLMVLPDAENYQQLERVILTAVREGSEGFMMA